MKKGILIFSFIFLLVLGLAFAAQGDMADRELVRANSTNLGEKGIQSNVSQRFLNREEPVRIEAREMIKEERKIRDMIKNGEEFEVRGFDRDIKVKQLTDEQKEIIAEKINAKTNLELTAEDIDNKTILRTMLSNGRNAEIKVMPDSASQRALERLRLRVCNESNNCRIELKETGSGNKTRLTYELQLERHSRILGIFKAKMNVKSRINAENGEVIGVAKPWWAFLASEPAETSEDVVEDSS